MVAGCPNIDSAPASTGLSRALEEGREPWTSGGDMRRALEIGIALRESHRRDHVPPVSLPIEDRSLRILPSPGRWLNKREVYGDEWYEDAMTAHQRP